VDKTRPRLKLGNCRVWCSQQSKSLLRRILFQFKPTYYTRKKARAAPEPNKNYAVWCCRAVQRQLWRNATEVPWIIKLRWSKLAASQKRCRRETSKARLLHVPIITDWIFIFIFIFETKLAKPLASRENYPLNSTQTTPSGLFQYLPALAPQATGAGITHHTLINPQARFQNWHDHSRNVPEISAESLPGCQTPNIRQHII
jgi:hypothetical protein